MTEIDKPAVIDSEKSKFAFSLRHLVMVGGAVVAVSIAFAAFASHLESEGHDKTTERVKAVETAVHEIKSDARVIEVKIDHLTESVDKLTDMNAAQIAAHTAAQAERSRARASRVRENIEAGRDAMAGIP